MEGADNLKSQCGMNRHSQLKVSGTNCCQLAEHRAIVRRFVVNPAGQARQAPLKPHTERVSAARLHWGTGRRPHIGSKGKRLRKKFRAWINAKAPPLFFFRQKVEKSDRKVERS